MTSSLGPRGSRASAVLRRQMAPPASGRVWEGAGWLVLSLLILLAVLRWTHTDSWWLVIAATALSPWLYFSAWVIAVGGAIARRWAITVVAGALVVLSLVWLWPQWDPFSRAAPPPVGAVPLRLFDANVQFTNPSLGPIAQEIRRAQPDVVTLEELSYSNMGSLLATGVLAGYRWHFIRPQGGANGFGVWSDVPMTGMQVWYAQRHPELRGWLQPKGTPRLRLYVVHTDAPRRSMAGAWRTEMATITTALRSEPKPLLVVGDFNATWDMYEFQDLLHTGLNDAAVEEGKGWQMTWSRQTRILPPLVRIDHVLYSPGLTVTAYRTGVGQGSDHRPLVVRLAITPSASG